jgi:hypothetical protein
MLRTIFFWALVTNVCRAGIVIVNDPVIFQVELFRRSGAASVTISDTGSSSQIAAISSRPRRASIPSVRSPLSGRLTTQRIR